jgi:hypothetical protein
MSRVVITYWSDCDTYHTCAVCGDYAFYDNGEPAAFLLDGGLQPICNECAEKADPLTMRFFDKIYHCCCPNDDRPLQPYPATKPFCQFDHRECPGQCGVCLRIMARGYHE